MALFLLLATLTLLEGKLASSGGTFSQSGTLPLLTAVVIVVNLDAYEIPAGMKTINIMGMSVTNAVACAVIPAVYYLVQI